MFFGATPFASSPFADPGFSPDAFVNVQGSRVNTDTGTVTIQGNALILPTGSSTTIRIGNVTIGLPITVPVTGNPFRLFIDTNVIVKAGADVDVTGNETALASGTVTPPDQTIGLTGEGLEAGTSDVTVAAKADVDITGNEFDIGTSDVSVPDIAFKVSGNGYEIGTSDATAKAGASAQITGVEFDSATGDVTITGKANVTVTGNRVDINLGTAVAKANAVVEVTTNLLNAATGTVTTKVNVRQDITGQRINVATQDVSIRQWDGIVPGATQVWVEKQPGKGS